MANSLLDCIRSLIQTRSDFVLVTHVEPDGDGIGSALALWHVLRALLKRADVWIPGGLPAKYAFLPGATEVVREHGPSEVAIALDCDDERRLGPIAETVLASQVVIDIDHHAHHQPFGHISWCDATAPAVGFQVYGLIRALDAEITPAVATNLYCAVGTDSGYFRYSNTSPRLLRMAAELVEFGADPKAIAEATLDRFPPEVVRLAGRALASVKSCLRGRVALAVLTREDYRAAGTEQTEGIIDYLRTVAGVEVVVLMRETEKGWRVSLRSLGSTNVGEVARALGGGGHPPAAGCTLDGTFEQAWATLASVLEPTLERGRR